ncbi:MAG TPA: hypothetical protein VJ976_09345 [Ornithinimicrobium sp.]|nr:hypothetical protein [Ornithinimicrobium sp.]
MAESPTFASPVSPTPSARESEVSLSDCSGTAMVLLRADPDGDLAASIGVRYGASRVAEGVTISGQRPGAWALTGDSVAVHALVASLEVTEDAHSVDVTHGVALLRLRGALAAATLEKICGLDWSESMMPDGAVVSGSVALVLCHILRQDDHGAPSYHISCERSYGSYLFEAILDAGAEFGITVR